MEFASELLEVHLEFGIQDVSNRLFDQRRNGSHEGFQLSHSSIHSSEVGCGSVAGHAQKGNQDRRLIPMLDTNFCH